jgi:hypothetical protein
MRGFPQPSRPTFCQIGTGGKVAGVRRWPPTASGAAVKERVELYLYSLSGSSLPVLGSNSPSCPSVPLYIHVYLCVCGVYVCVCLCVCMCVSHSYVCSQILLQHPPVLQLLNNVHHRVHNSPTLSPVHSQTEQFQVLQSLSLQHTQCCPVIYI